MARPDQQSKKWCSTWNKSNKGYRHQTNCKSSKRWNNSWRPTHKWIFHNANLVDKWI